VKCPVCATRKFRAISHARFRTRKFRAISHARFRAIDFARFRRDRICIKTAISNFRLCMCAELAAASLLPAKGDATDFVRALTDGLARLAARLAHTKVEQCTIAYW
jgi:hypothetical protein